MGQQQLLLVILVTIIVGIATVVAINTFGAAADSATLDAVRQDLATIAAGAQGYYMKPAMLGGGGRTFDGITFNDIAFSGGLADPETAGADPDPLIAENENGTYTMSGTTGDDFIVTAVANDTETTEIQARICPDNIVMGDAGATAAPAACPS